MCCLASSNCLVILFSNENNIECLLLTVCLLVLLFTSLTLLKMFNKHWTLCTIPLVEFATLEASFDELLLVLGRPTNTITMRENKSATQASTPLVVVGECGSGLVRPCAPSQMQDASVEELLSGVVPVSCLNVAQCATLCSKILQMLQLPDFFLSMTEEGVFT
jgi:hypothetical protein